MAEHGKKKTFLDLPRFIGDRKSFKEFVRLNLKYPKEALEKGIQGVVHLSYMVNDKGQVTHVDVEKGLGYGCDEEAIRLVRMMRFSKAKNRGYKVSARNKTRIEFKLPKKQISYELKKQEEPSTNTKEPPKSTYSYSIKINPSKPKQE